eukprot:Skav222461  [mRNA]  locus=scaffold5414:3595:11104:- [translate_table: standard]
MARGLLGAGVCGFMRSMPLEAPQLKTQVLDLPSSFATSVDSWAEKLSEELACQELGPIPPWQAPPASTTPRQDLEQEVAWGAQRKVTLLDDFESTQLVTGGLGGLGLVTAAALCVAWASGEAPRGDLGARSVLLCSRRGQVASGDEVTLWMVAAQQLEELQSRPNVTVTAWACDLSLRCPGGGATTSGAAVPWHCGGIFTGSPALPPMPYRQVSPELRILDEYSHSGELLLKCEGLFTVPTHRDYRKQNGVAGVHAWFSGCVDQVARESVDLPICPLFTGLSSQVDILRQVATQLATYQAGVENFFSNEAFEVILRVSPFSGSLVPQAPRPGVPDFHPDLSAVPCPSFARQLAKWLVSLRWIASALDPESQALWIVTSYLELFGPSSGPRGFYRPFVATVIGFCHRMTPCWLSFSRRFVRFFVFGRANWISFSDWALCLVGLRPVLWLLRRAILVPPVPAPGFQGGRWCPVSAFCPWLLLCSAPVG